jgi:hemerythrin-like domain-containing protein
MGANYHAEFMVWARAAHRQGAAAQHPVDELLAEHYLIQRVLEAIQIEAAKIRKRRDLNLDFWERAVDIAGNFALLFHYAKKANHFFPAIEPFGMREKIAALEEEQQHDIMTTLELCNAVSDRDGETVQRLVSLYVGSKRKHMEREENEVLLPSKALLTEAKVDELRQTFDEMESPPGKHRKTYLEVALSVIREAGLPDPMEAPA